MRCLLALATCLARTFSLAGRVAARRSRMSATLCSVNVSYQGRLCSEPEGCDRQPATRQ